MINSAAALNAAKAAAVLAVDNPSRADQPKAELQLVQWRHHGHHFGGYHGGYRGYGHYHGGYGFFPGAVIGGVLGGVLASQPRYYYEPAPVYVAPGPSYGPSVAWCEQHYRSYDPGSGTYLGYDGRRHSCP